jgi:hypothetical protein
MPPQCRSAEFGFTLVEAMIAATLMATAIVAVAHLTAIGVRQSAASGRTLAAALSAQGKLEQLTAGALPIGAGDEAGEFRLQWTIAPIEPADATLVAVRVCAYGSPALTVPPQACVATIRRRLP